MQDPLIHPQGTPPQVLLDRYRLAAKYLRAAKEALKRSCPADYDYWPKGIWTFQEALQEHLDRLGRLDVILGEINALAQAVAKGNQCSSKSRQ